MNKRDDQITRINELSTLARTAWFTLLGYLVFVGITLLGVRDADFFVPSRQTDLPLVNVSIPTASFFWIAPILGAALYTHLHLFLIKLWDAHGEARTSDADATHHWLVGDFVLIRQGDEDASRRPLAFLTDGITRLLVWAAGPFVLGYAWWRSMPAHAEWMTLLIGACFWLTLVVGFTSWWRAEDRLRQLWPGLWTTWWRRAAAAGTGLVLIAVSWLRTEGGLEDYVTWGWTLDDVSFTVPADTPVVRWFTDEELLLPLARTDLIGEELVPLPDDWRASSVARAAFRETFCRREGIAMDACGQPAAPRRGPADPLLAARKTWCNDHGGFMDGDCIDHFADLDRRFANAWTEERRSEINALPSLDLRRRDLRRADASFTSLVGADLRGARMGGAVLSRAQMDSANLSRAQLGRAVLRGAQMDGGNLSWAQMDGADFRGAEMDGTNLFGAQMNGTNLSGANLRRSAWASASIRASLAHTADLRGTTGLTQGKLEELIGNDSTLLPQGLDLNMDQSLHIWSCWATPPLDLDRIIAYAAEPLANDATRAGLHAALRAAFLCGPDNSRRKTGTPLALDAPYPEGHPLAGRD